VTVAVGATDKAWDNFTVSCAKSTGTGCPNYDSLDQLTSSFSYLLAFDGNSLTSGTGSSGGQTYPKQTYDLLGIPWAYVNYGVPSQTTTDMASDAATQIDTTINTNFNKNILVAWEITNDLYFGANATTAYNNFVSYCQARKAAGWKVIVLTVLPRSNVGTPGDFEASRSTVNTSIRSNWSTFASALADVAADSRIGDANDELDTTYYPDKVHLNNDGYAIVAGIVKNAIDSLL